MMRSVLASRLPQLGFCLALFCSLSARAEDRKKPPPRVKPAPAPSAPANAPPPADKCAEATASTRYEGYGYTHVVTLRNGCQKPVACSLWTDVDPEPRQMVQAAPGESVEIVTRKGSPSRDVSALKSCSYR